MDENLKNHTEIVDITFDHDGSHVALCHKEQGYSANLWGEKPLILKSDLNLDNVTNLNIMKALEQVTITTTLEDVLDKYFDLWGFDAALLAKVLGFDTEVEHVLANDQDLEDWEIDHLASLLNMQDEMADKFTIISKSNQYDESLLEDLEFRKKLHDFHYKVQQLDTEEFYKAAVGSDPNDFAYVPDRESPSTWKLNISDAAHTRAAVAALGEGFRGNRVQIPSEDLDRVKSRVRSAYSEFFPDNEIPDVIKSASGKNSTEVEVLTSGGKASILNKNNKEGSVPKEESVAEFEELLKAHEELKSQLNETREILQKEKEERALIIKAQKEKEQAEAKANMEELVKGFDLEFDEELKKDALVESLLETKDFSVIKALSSMKEKVDAAEAEVERVKKEFAKPAGVDDQVDVNKGTSSDIAQRVKEIIKNNKKNK